MKHTTIIAIFLSLSLIACNHRSSHTVHHEETPKALEDKSSFTDITLTKRMGNDLIDKLYQELSDKDSVLKSFNQSISAIEDSKNDSLKAFENYNGKNTNYYHTAKNYITNIKDSILRKQMLALIEGSEAKYNKQVLLHTQLIDSIDKQSTELEDLYAIVKIVNTLPLIQKYQKDNLPNTKALNGYLDTQNKVIKTAKALGKK